MICAEEKTSIQARCRCHLPCRRAQPARCASEHDYGRGGALAYLAAWEVHRAQVTGRCEPTTGITPFARLAEQVMTAEPSASAHRVLWIVDNGSSHRGAASAIRMASTWPNAHLIHLPPHASWLDQAEIHFSTVHRIQDPLQHHRQAVRLEVHRTHLHDLLHRIDAHDKTQRHVLAA